jgi:D-glycero-alpha-D-manno-heptose 1-phosphate guanylyltransferase
MDGIGALVLSGGLGTRLRCAFASGPKGMAPVNGRPFLAYLVDQLRAAGLLNIILCIGHQGEQITEFFGDGSSFGVNLRYSIENKLLGTGGAIKNAEALLPKGHFFILNGDSYFDADLRAMLAFNAAARGMGSLGVVHVEDSSRYGSIVLDNSCRIIEFKEKESGTPAGSGAKAGYVSAGVYLFDRSILDAIPPMVPTSLEREVLPALLARGLFGFRSSGFFIDIGIPSDYLKAQTELPKRLAR